MAVRAALALLAALVAAPLASAHGDLAIHELETLAIRDFEGMEDSFPWGGFEIWDVYVGEGYNETLDSDGVYLKVNLAGSGEQKPPGGQAWKVAFAFNVGGETFERQLTHDGTTITTDFESLQWMVADGNVLQVKAWVPVAAPAGKTMTDIVLVSSVDDKPRDTAPGGVHDPATGQEAPVTAPASGVFPPMGEGRIVDEVPLTGPGKLLNVTLTPLGGGAFRATITNVLKEQGQHVFLRADPVVGWNMSAKAWSVNLDGGASKDIEFTLLPDAAPGASVDPLDLSLVSDIGGRRLLFGYLEGSDVKVVEDASLATPAVLPEATEVPSPAFVGIVGAVALALALRRR